MSNISQVTNYEYIRSGTVSVPVITLAKSSPAGSTSLVLNSPITDQDGNAITNASIVSIDVGGITLECYIAPGGWTSTTTATITTRQTKRGGLDITTADTANDIDAPASSPVKDVLSALHMQQINDAQQGNIGSAIKHSKRETFMANIPSACPIYASLAAGTAAITPQNGDSFYATAEGLFYDYTGGSWVSRASGGSFPNASTTVAGKVQTATQSQIDAGTATTGSTGANLEVMPAQINPFNLTNAKTTPAASDLITLSDSAAANALVKMTYANLVPAGSGAITGEMRMWGTVTPPTGWLICDGSAINRTTYAALFAVIGTTYGTGDGSTTFNIPDFRGRAPIGAGTGSATGATAHTLGATPTSGASGEEKHTISSGELPAHTHTISVVGGASGPQAASGSGAYLAGTASTTGSTGSGTAANIMQPSTCVEFIIKT